MNNNKWLEIALNILSFLRPKFYNRITWWIVGVGLGLIGATPLLERVMIVFFEKQLSLFIPCDVNNAIGILLILIALIYNLVMKIIDNSYELGLASKNSPAVQSDIVVYNKIMHFLPYSEVDSFAHYDFMGSFRWDNYKNIDLYREKMNSPELSFFNEELNRLKDEFDQALSSFQNTLARFTFPIDGKTDVYKVPDDWEFDLPDKYTLAEKLINESQDRFSECYDSLIEGCRRKLGV